MDFASRNSAHAAASAWSMPINGLSGRLVVEFEDLDPGLRHAVYLELKNNSPRLLGVTNQPRIQPVVLTSTGKAVGTAGMSMNGPEPSLQWAVIPPDSYVGYRVDMQTAGVPTREHGTALMAVGGVSWLLPSGKYVLKATVVFDEQRDGPHNQWVGELHLTSSAFRITQEMVAVH
jgi:hypothetical protein